MKKTTVFDFLDEEKPPATSEPKKGSLVFEGLEEEEEEKKKNLPRQEENVPQEFPFEGENDLEREIERNQARSFSRFGETLLGAPGDISNFITNLLGLPKSPIGYLNSENLRKGSEKLTGGYTKPQTEFEKSADEAVERFATMALPGSWGYSFARNLGIPIAATLAKEGVKAKAGEEKGTYAELGTMLFLDLLGGRISTGGAKGYSNSLFRQRDKLIPEGEIMDASNLRNSLTELKTELNKGGSATSTKSALTKIDELLDRISKEGAIAVEELPEFQTKINEAILEGGGFEIQVPKPIKRRTVENLKKVKGEVINALTEYGEKQNPEFLNLHRKANRSRAVYEKSNVISNFLKKNFGNKISNPVLKTLFGLGGAAATGAGAVFKPAITTGATGVVGAGAGIYQAIKLGYRIAKSPELRKYYTEVIKHSLAGNTTQTEKSLKALEKALKEKKIEREEKLVNP